MFNCGEGGRLMDYKEEDRTQTLEHRRDYKVNQACVESKIGQMQSLQFMILSFMENILRKFISM